MTPPDRIDRAIDALRDDLLAFAQRLIRIPSTPGREAPAQQCAAAQMRALGLDVQTVEATRAELSSHPAFRMTRLSMRIVAAAALVVCAGVAGFAQRRGMFSGVGREPALHNGTYDGRFTFVRLKFDTAPGGCWYRGLPAWAHGYPTSEENLMQIMNEVTYLDPHIEDLDVLALDDPELFKYPVAYIIEPGWWTPTETEAGALRTYIEKGGFVIVDDFKVRGWGGGMGGGGWENFEAQMQKVLPAARFVEMDIAHPIFHSFFEIRTLENFPQAYNAGPAIFRGIFEDNDPSKRLQMIINYNTDISQFWEWSGRGLRPINDTNEAYKLGVNYVIYGLTH
jgi:hypothetical protein